MGQGFAPSLPEPSAFFLETPPYQKFRVTTADFVEILSLEHFDDILDAHCVECSQHSTFRCDPKRLSLDIRNARIVGMTTIHDVDITSLTKKPNNDVESEIIASAQRTALADRVFQKKFICARSKDHTLYFFVRLRSGVLAKIGQSPSLADLQLADVGKYRKVLGETRHQEFTKAVGLNAHGVGIGAFAYLRRIFEGLIGDAHREAKTEAGWDDQGFETQRMEEKILRLRSKLPDFLVSNRVMYGILSKGLHDLDEQECLDHFQHLKLGIELVLDEEIERRARVEKARQASAALNAIQKKMGRS